jgi:hypothetical protein
MDGEELGLLDGTGTAEETGSDESFIEETQTSETSDGAESGSHGDDEAVHGGSERVSTAIVKAEPLAIRKALREISESNPDFAKKFPTLEKSVTRALFQSNQIEKFGGLQKVRETLDALEIHGGIDSIQEMAEEVTALHELTTGFERGDPKVVDGWAKDFPEGFKKLMVPAFDKLETLDAQHFNIVGSYVIDKIFQSFGVYSALHALGDALKQLPQGDETSNAVTKFNPIVKFLTDAKDLAVRAKAGRTDRDAELDEREQEISTRDAKQFHGSVAIDVNTAVTAEMNRLIRIGLPQGRKVKVETANRLRKEITAETGRLANNQSGYQEQMKSVMGAKNKERAVNFFVSNAKKFLPKVVKQMLAEFNLTGPAGTSANGNGQRRVAVRSEAGTVAGRPKTNDIDFTRTDKSMWLRSLSANRALGPIYLRNGKQAKW